MRDGTEECLAVGGLVVLVLLLNGSDVSARGGVFAAADYDIDDKILLIVSVHASGLVNQCIVPLHAYMRSNNCCCGLSSICRRHATARAGALTSTLWKTRTRSSRRRFRMCCSGC